MCKDTKYISKMETKKGLFSIIYLFYFYRITENPQLKGKSSPVAGGASFICSVVTATATGS